MREASFKFVVFLLCLLLAGSGGYGFSPTVLSPLAKIPPKISGGATLPDIYDNCFEGLLITNEEIRGRTEEIAAELKSIHSAAGGELCLVCVLKGSFHFCSMLCDALSQASVPYEIEFIRAKSYLGKTSGELEISSLGEAATAANEYRGKDLIIVEDIIDTGKTMTKLVAKFKSDNAKTVLPVTLLDKRDVEGRVRDFGPYLAGFSIADEFVVGFGLDYNERFRDVLDVYILSEEGVDRYKEG